MAATADFTPLETELSEMTSVVDSSVAFMDGFQSRLDAAITADNLADNSNVARLRDAFAAQKVKLAEAIARGTAGEGDGTGGTGGGEPAP